ncbi:MAG: NAD(P)-dependent alcohol dehydrogenase [Actinomycetota bacterium]|nr:NAD(P)-dependent alcohol dehydrogenase [Actinomycetota bacterium]
MQDTYGEADVLRLSDIPVPTPADDEVLLRVDAAGIEMSVWHLMTGRPYLVRLAMGLRRPRQRVRGADVAGTIVSVGAAVTTLAVGDRVFGACNGSLAEFATAKAATLAAAPATLSSAEAATLPVSGCAALHALDAAGISAGQRVLVIGAGGAVGHFAVQLAKARGAHVTGVGSSRSAGFIGSLGADEVIDYTVERFEESDRSFDVIIDTAGNRPLGVLRRSLSPAGAIVIVGAETGGRIAGGLGRVILAPIVSALTRTRIVALMSNEGSAALDRLRDLADSGAVRPRIARTWPLEDGAEAVRALTSRQSNGRLVVTVTD